jgi:hypothetical protein
MNENTKLMKAIRAMIDMPPVCEKELANRLDEFAGFGARPNRYRLTFNESTQYFEAGNQTEAQTKASVICGKAGFKLEQV